MSQDNRINDKEFDDGSQSGCENCGLNYFTCDCSNLSKCCEDQIVQQNKCAGCGKMAEAIGFKEL